MGGVKVETLGAVISVRQTGLALSRDAHAVINTKKGVQKVCHQAFLCCDAVGEVARMFARRTHPRMAPYVSNLASISETAPRKGESTPRKRGQDSALCIKSSDISAKDATHAGSFPFAAAREDFIQTLYQVMERVL